MARLFESADAKVGTVGTGARNGARRFIQGSWEIHGTLINFLFVGAAVLKRALRFGAFEAPPNALHNFALDPRRGITCLDPGGNCVALDAARRRIITRYRPRKPKSVYATPRNTRPPRPSRSGRPRPGKTSGVNRQRRQIVVSRAAALEKQKPRLAEDGASPAAHQPFSRKDDENLNVWKRMPRRKHQLAPLQPRRLRASQSFVARLDRSRNASRCVRTKRST